MNIISSSALMKHPSNQEASLAEQLRALASDVERGDVRQLIVTVIRQDGRVERMGASAGEN
ncbi:MAG: hypothetical protein H6R10_1511 [Rhodocyclaceae bacterium]|nr:hypothetical protein [Rhodocyclaceae bacterium]